MRKIIIPMDTSALSGIGLSKAEIKVYLALLELGPSAAGSVLSKADVQNSVFHFCINRLIAKGLVSHIRKGKRKIYKAADPGSMLHFVKDKEMEIEKILPSLKAIQNKKFDKQGAEIFVGKKGIMAVLNELISEAKKGDEFLFFSADVREKNKEIQDFYRKFDLKRKSKLMVTKGIAPIRMVKYFSRRKYIKMKYVDFAVPANMGICRDKMTLISWDESPVGVLIQAKNLVDKQRNFFYDVWNRQSVILKGKPMKDFFGSVPKWKGKGQDLKDRTRKELYD